MRALLNKIHANALPFELAPIKPHDCHACLLLGAKFNEPTNTLCVELGVIGELERLHIHIRDTVKPFMKLPMITIGGEVPELEALTNRDAFNIGYLVEGGVEGPYLHTLMRVSLGGNREGATNFGAAAAGRRRR